MATEKTNEALVEMKLDKVTTEERISDLNRLIDDLNNQKESFSNELTRKSITAQEYRVSVKEIEQQLQQHLADLAQQKQKLRSIRWAISYKDRSRI
ncbi:hypothetical protein [Larkinella sp. C7]|uniref:hypothetical protein n=1 Tax=Larkinella sp. C7 TaxID=2576607 RepID=UPI0011115827|nr:hypothetical protein [Larkinella sp. C7]